MFTGTIQGHPLIPFNNTQIHGLIMCRQFFVQKHCGYLDLAMETLKAQNLAIETLNVQNLPMETLNVQNDRANLPSTSKVNLFVPAKGRILLHATTNMHQLPNQRRKSFYAASPYKLLS